MAGICQAIEAAGAHLRYLPACSPDFKPIEQAFPKLKALLRTAAARTVPDLWAAIRDAFTRFKPGSNPTSAATASPQQATMPTTQPERQRLWSRSRS